jgi:hypothetical protein
MTSIGVEISIDRLLGIHVHDIVRAIDLVDDLEHQQEVAVLEEVRVIEAGPGLGAHDLLDDESDLIQLLAR